MSAVDELQAGLLDYTTRINEQTRPADVLDTLHDVVSQRLPLLALGAARVPLNSGDLDALQIGRSVFIHSSVPSGWVQEYCAHARGRFRPTLTLALTSMATFSWIEARRLLQPLGSDQWAFNLCLKYGMRDGVIIPIGGRWVVTFWSRKDVTNIVTPPLRIMLNAVTGFAALRMEQVAGLDADLIGRHTHLTSRELAVLRFTAAGRQSGEIAEALKLGEETIRTHQKKAQAKLGARNKTQAVAEALRQHLIP